MPRSKTNKSPKAPALMDSNELESTIKDLVESFRGAKSIEDRRNLILRLIRRGMRPGEISRYILGPFGIKRGTLNDDIRWCKDQELRWAREKNIDGAMAEALGANAEIRRQAFAKGDLQVANAANQHFSKLRKLTDEGITLNVQEADKTSDQRREALAQKLARLSQSSPKK